MEEAKVVVKKDDSSSDSDCSGSSDCEDEVPAKKETKKKVNLLRPRR
jgi:hypothetical protein